MKTRRWIVITVLASALSMPVSLVTAAPSASSTITPPLPSPAPKGSEVRFALVITVTDINPEVVGVDIHVGYYDKLLAPPLSPTAKGTVLRQGTPARPNPGGGTLACSEVKIIPSISSPVFTIDESVLPNFEFSLANPSAGAYTIQAGYSGYLASEARTTIPPSKDVGTTTLCGGDVNADRVINILDIGTITVNFGKTNMPVRSDVSVPPLFPDDCADPDEPTDINDDSLVNISDLAIAAGNWGLTEATLWETTQCNP
jgi:hypothetical protein